MTEAIPRFSEFRKLAQQGNVVPVYRAVTADLLSPVSAFLRMVPPSAKASRYSFLLESVEGGEHVGRYTFFGANPFEIISSRGRQIVIERGGRRREESGNIFEYMRQAGRAYQPAARPPGLPQFSGGAVGYLAYEAVRMLEKLLPRVEPDVDVNDALFMYFTDLAAFDHVEHRLYLIANVLTEDGPGSLRAKYDAACERLDRMERLLHRPLVLPRVPRPRGPLRVRSNMSQKQYEAMVKRGKEYIQAGDVFQVVVSQRLTAPVRVPPFAIYRALRVVNPSPYMYYLRLDEATVLGSSPEMLVKVSGREVEHRPIAGTRPRGKTKDEDQRLEDELKSDEKERAEHVMHLVSSIQGTLKPEADSYAALAATFPDGTLTGAPKVRAMEIIDELEPTRRGLYGGSVLYLDFSGNLEACVAIRTVYIHGGKAYLQAGAGIVADSVPAREYEESMYKARAGLKAMEMAEKGL